MKTERSNLVGGAYVDFQMACLKALPRFFSETECNFWARNGELLAYALDRVVKLEPRKSLLAEKNRIDIPAIGKFVVREAFRPCGVICDTDERFIKRFLKKTENSMGSATIIAYQAEVAYEAAIILELGHSCAITLGQLWHLLCSQRNGKKGFLLTDGEMNTVYAFDCNGVLAPVNVFWNSARAGWHIQGGSHLTAGMLADARQVLSYVT